MFPMALLRETYIIYSPQKYAFLSLYDKSSTDFVLQKEWICFESAMRLSKVKEKRIQRTEKKTQCKQSGEVPHPPKRSIRSPSLSPLQEYHQGKSKFWVDVPHEKAIPAKAAFRYKKKKTPYISVNLTSGKQHKCKRNTPAKTKKKKSKTPKLDIDISYESFLEELKPFLQDTRDEKQSVHQEIKPKHDSCKLEYKRPTAAPKMKIQLIFKGRSLYTEDVEDKMNISLDDIKVFVQENERIPVNMQLLLYDGHILREDHLRHLKDGDCIHVLCRGMGGMQCGSADGQGKESSTCQLHITSESSEDEVQKWLLEVIRVPSEFRDKFRFLDGKSIDECKDYTDLSSTLLIPIGLARKIFYMRSHDLWFTNIDTSTISSWSTDDLSEYLKNVSY
ncbi:hypothetical protein ACJMK2_016533 [Sinanodonta woodiana]|uniref:Ubiquitin-like domain-containing protein n=1 Tax=Sinanodonta woodiana TaxID=1069815 RepID=A0ABD3UWZ6_SINWO